MPNHTLHGPPRHKRLAYPLPDSYVLPEAFPEPEISIFQSLIDGESPFRQVCRVDPQSMGVKEGSASKANSAMGNSVTKGCLTPIRTPGNGQVSTQDPLTSAQRENQFITWLYAQNRVTGQVSYLKWIKWQISYSVAFDFTKAVPETKNTWIFKELSEGDGVGPMAPVHTAFTVTPNVQAK